VVAVVAFMDAGDHARRSPTRATSLQLAPARADDVRSGRPFAYPVSEGGALVTEPQILDAAPTDGGGSLLGRVPGQAVMAECLRAQAGVRPRSRLARVLGLSPLAEENRPWFRGALGEQEVGRRLAGLGPGWTVLHAVPVGAKDSDIDHVVIGPTGVFTLNTKNHSGQKVWVAGGTFMVNGQRQPHLRNAEHEAQRAAKLLGSAVGQPVPVRGAIVVVDPGSLTIRERPRSVGVVTSRGLLRWLTQGRDVLTPADVVEISAAVSQPGTWHRDPRPAENSRVLVTRFAALHREERGARRVQNLWRGGLAAAVLVCLATVVPAVAQDAANAFVGALMP